MEVKVLEILKVGGPVFALSVFALWLGYKIWMSVVPPLVANNAELGKTVGELTAKLEVLNSD